MSQNPPFVPPQTHIQMFPIQPLYIDQHGTVRFVSNRIVQELLDHSSRHGYDMNEIARQAGNGLFSAAEQMQFAQLIGYSMHGWGTLSYVTDEAYAVAEEAYDKLQHEYK